MLKKKNTSLIISYVILIVLAFIMIYPLLWMVGASFKSNDEIFSTVGLLPKHPVFGAFAAGWEGTGRYGFSTYLLNSFELVLPTVLFTVISGILIGLVAVYAVEALKRAVLAVVGVGALHHVLTIL